MASLSSSSDAPLWKLPGHLQTDLKETPEGLVGLPEAEVVGGFATDDHIELHIESSTASTRGRVGNEGASEMSGALASSRDGGQVTGVHRSEVMQRLQMEDTRGGRPCAHVRAVCRIPRRDCARRR